MYIGNFVNESGQMIVSDPCYDLNDNELNKILEVLPGQWEFHILKDKRNRVESWTAYHEDFNLDNCQSLELEDQFGVDSGQLGLWDTKYFKNDKVVPLDFINKKGEYEEDWCANTQDTSIENDPWYWFNCSKTIDTEDNAGIVPFGAISQSGYGDGIYFITVFNDIDSRAIVGISVTF